MLGSHSGAAEQWRTEKGGWEVRGGGGAPPPRLPQTLPFGTTLMQRHCEPNMYHNSVVNTDKFGLRIVLPNRNAYSKVKAHNMTRRSMIATWLQKFYQKKKLFY
jgi:hypothetical protein